MPRKALRTKRATRGFAPLAADDDEAEASFWHRSDALA